MGPVANPTNVGMDHHDYTRHGIITEGKRQANRHGDKGQFRSDVAGQAAQAGIKDHQNQHDDLFALGTHHIDQLKDGLVKHIAVHIHADAGHKDKYARDDVRRGHKAFANGGKPSKDVNGRGFNEVKRPRIDAGATIFKGRSIIYACGDDVGQQAG